MNETTILILLAICAIVSISTLAVLLYFARKVQLQNRGVFARLDSAKSKLTNIEEFDKSLQVLLPMVNKLDHLETLAEGAGTKITNLETLAKGTGTKITNLETLAKGTGTKITNLEANVDRISNQQSGIENQLHQNQEKSNSFIETFLTYQQGIENNLRVQTKKLNKLKLLNSMQYIQSTVKDQDSTLHKGRDDIKEQPIVDITKNLKNKKPVTILVAGMRHSGSTALFNCIRYLLLDNGIEIESGYSEHDHFPKLDIRSNKVRLIKTHEYRDDVALAADFIFTTKRDLRETVASAVRRDFPLLKQVGGIVNYAKYNKNVHDNWASTSDFEMVYEEYKADELSMTLKICQALGFENIDIHALCTKVNNTPKDQYNETLLSESHITNPDGKFIYRDNLSHEDIHIIECQNVTWLEKNGYLDAGDL